MSLPEKPLLIFPENPQLHPCSRIRCSLMPSQKKRRRECCRGHYQNTTRTVCGRWGSRVPIKACFCRFSAKSSCSRSRRASRNCVLSCRLRWQTGEYACSTTGIRRDQRKRKDLRRAQAYLPDDRGMRQNTSEASRNVEQLRRKPDGKAGFSTPSPRDRGRQVFPSCPLQQKHTQKSGHFRISENTQKTDTGRREFLPLSERKNMPNTISTYAVF